MVADGTQGPGNLSPGGEPADQGPGHERVRTRGGAQSVQGAETPLCPLPSRGKGGLLSREAWYRVDQAQLKVG